MPSSVFFYKVVPFYAQQNSKVRPIEPRLRAVHEEDFIGK